MPRNVEKKNLIVPKTITEEFVIEMSHCGTFPVNTARIIEGNEFFFSEPGFFGEKKVPLSIVLEASLEARLDTPALTTHVRKNSDGYEAIIAYSPRIPSHYTLKVAQAYGLGRVLNRHFEKRPTIVDEEFILGRNPDVDQFVFWLLAPKELIDIALRHFEGKDDIIKETAGAFILSRTFMHHRFKNLGYI